MADSTTKLVTYQLQGDDTGLMRTINGAIKKLDALDVKLSRIASRKDVSPIGEGTTRDAISRITSVTKAINNLEKVRSTLSTINTDMLTKPQLAVIKLAATELNNLAKSLGKASEAGKITQEQLDTVNQTTARLQKVIKAANIVTVDAVKEEKKANREAAKAVREKKEAEREAAAAARASAEEYKNAVRTIKNAVVVTLNILRNVLRVGYDLMAQAADFGETMNKFNVIVDKSAKTLGQFADTMAYTLGLDPKDMYESVATFASIAKSVNLANDKAEIFSKTLTMLSVDLASLYNTSVDQAMNALTSGLHGQLRPLKNYNVYLYETNLRQTALEHGITKSVSAMNEFEKVCLRYISILDQTKDAQGDMARTLGSAANQIKIVQAQFAQLKRSLGQIATVVGITVVPALNLLLSGLVKIFTLIASGLGYEIKNFANLFGNSADATDEATGALETFGNTAAGLSGLDEINVITGTTTSTSGLGIDKAILDAMKSYDNLMGNIERKIGEMSDKIGQSLQDTFAADVLETFIKALKGLGDAFNFVMQNWETFEPLIKSLINLLTIFLGITVAKTVIGWGAAFKSFVAKLIPLSINLPVAQRNMQGFLQATTQSVNGATLAWSALTLAMTAAIASSIYSIFEGESKKLAATIGLLIAVLTGGAIAWLAYHGAMSWGVAVPIITAAVGLGAASIKAMIPQMAEGGVVDQPTVAMIGEGRYNEAVVPLGNSPQFASMKADIADEVARKLAQTPSYPIGSTPRAGSRGDVILNVNGRELARAILPDIGITRPQTGVKLV